MIKELYKDNLALHKELSKQSKIIDEAEKYQKERDKILADNEKLHDKVKNLDFEFNSQKRKLEKEYQEKERILKSNLNEIVNDYEKENKHLKRLVETFKKTIKLFIKWICKKFDVSEDYDLIRDFEKETRVSLDAEKQVKKEDREKEIEWDLER